LIARLASAGRATIKLNDKLPDTPTLSFAKNDVVNKQTGSKLLLQNLLLQHNKVQKDRTGSGSDSEEHDSKAQESYWKRKMRSIKKVFYTGETKSFGSYEDEIYISDYKIVKKQKGTVVGNYDGESDYVTVKFDGLEGHHKIWWKDLEENFESSDDSDLMEFNGRLEPKHVASASEDPQQEDSKPEDYIDCVRCKGTGKFGTNWVGVGKTNCKWCKGRKVLHKAATEECDVENCVSGKVDGVQCKTCKGIGYNILNWRRRLMARLVASERRMSMSCNSPVLKHH